jgi:deazaflavin-dependent oxidoreductase (nitroreductase family)
MNSSEPTYSRTRPALPQRVFLRSVVYLYRGWLGELFRWRCILRLTTTGRRTGKPRTTCVSFMPLDGHYVVFSGWGTRADWYRNLRAQPDVIVQVGRRRMRATAQLVGEPERRRELMLMMRDRSVSCGPPRVVRSLFRLARLFDYEEEIRLAVEHATHMPIVVITPLDG